MKHKTYRFLIAACALGMWISCKQSANFEVNGIIAGADGQTVYLENVGLSGTVTLDSVKLNASGKFSFRQPRPDYPDFYHLRLNNQLINFAIDSTEVLSFLADAGTFATSYTVEGSANVLAIKEITLAQLDANQAIKRLRKEYESGMISDSLYQSQVQEAIGSYKEIALKYIYTQPMSTTSYFALFQQIDGLLFFDLYDKTDSRAYGAVATSYNHFYPESLRARHLYNLALQSLKVLRSERTIDLDKIAKEISLLDIELPDFHGEKIKLSDVARDKVVILNFTVYQSEWSAELNTMLSRIYAGYHAQGMDIYQISLDNDMHLWKNIVSSLPWTCVRDPQSVYSQAAALYNVKRLPAIFILNREGNLVKRIEDFHTLEKEVQDVL
ncbi:MAG: AhpC/TSA family protein [Tannerella sp.]|jgi:peroxiredoxin|nr:AhpC/TSA family protein [Tannerella sp.]